MIIQMPKSKKQKNAAKTSIAQLKQFAIQNPVQFCENVDRIMRERDELRAALETYASRSSLYDNGERAREVLKEWEKANG